MDPLTAVLRPFARGWLRSVQAELSLLPTPPGAPRQHVRGPATDRILVFGNGPATGFGVLTQELGLPGQLARELARAAGRGTEVDLARGRGFTIASAAGRLSLLRLSRYDAVVVTLGATDAGGLLPEDHWEHEVRGLVATMRSQLSPTAPIVLLGIRPQAAVRQGWGVLNALVDQHAARLDAVSARVAAESEHVHQVAIEPALRSIGAQRYFSPESYHAIALQVATVLTPALDQRHLDGTWQAGQQQHDRTEVEEQRQQAVDAMQVATVQASDRLLRLVRSACTMFGTSGAALTIIDRDRQVHKASIGLGVDEIPRRLAVCDRTIQQDGPLVIADVTVDARTVDTDMQTEGEPVRFYAGYPIESPDGYRLGALCVFDAGERDPSEVDEEQLRDLALLVQNELWEEHGWTRAV